MIDLDNTSQWPEWPPVMTDSRGELVLPNVDRKIVLSQNAVVDMSCVGQEFEALSGKEFARAR